MPFRVKQKYKQAVCVPVFRESQVELESGQIINKNEDMCQVKLPKAELFDLNNVLKAGIEPDEVSSTILGSKQIDADKVIRKYTKRKENKKNKGENVNEK